MPIEPRSGYEVVLVVDNSTDNRPCQLIECFAEVADRYEILVSHRAAEGRQLIAQAGSKRIAVVAIDLALALKDNLAPALGLIAHVRNLLGQQSRDLGVQSPRAGRCARASDVGGRVEIRHDWAGR